MARITMIPGEQWPDSLRELAHADEKTALEQGNLRIYAHRPELAEAYARFMGAMRQPGLLSRRLVELVRIRVAFHNQCRSCMAVRYDDAAAEGVTEDLVCELAQPDEAPDLTDAERAALQFADLLASNHLAINDSHDRGPARPLQRGGDRRARHEHRDVRRLRPALLRLGHGRRAPRPLPRARRRPDHALGRRRRHSSGRNRSDRVRVYEGVAQTLVDHGVDVIFGLMGDGNLKLIPHLTSQLGVRFVSSRHESAGGRDGRRLRPRDGPCRRSAR